MADAVTSPYQAAMRTELQPGDMTIVIGTGGGLGSYMTQICSALGAKEVIGIDIAPEPDGTETNPFYETITFTEADDVTNAESQALVALHYHQIVLYIQFEMIQNCGIL